MSKLRAGLLAVLAFLLFAGPAVEQVSAAPIPLWVRKVSQTTPPPPTVPVLGPDPSWTGTPQSVPTDPTRVTAKPSIHWQKPSDMRLVTNKRLCVDADAFNSAGIYTPGIASVDIGNGSTSVSAAFVTNTYPNQLDGSIDSVPGWCADVNAAAFRAVSTSGSQNFWARANPSDATMQARVIGGPKMQGGYDTEAYGGNYIMTMFPRTTENDTSVTVCGSGGATYTTLLAAFDALRVTSFEAPLITITCSGSYIIADASGTERTSGQRAVLTVANGVNAILGQAGITYNSTPTWDVRLGWDGIEFRGNPLGSLTFDAHWLRNLQFASKAGWFNGVYITNSVGTADSLYWNGDRPPEFGTSSLENPYVDDVVATYATGTAINARYAMNSKWSHVYGNILYGSAYAFNTWTNDYDNAFTQNGGGANNTTGFNIAYSGSGGGLKSITVYAPSTGSTSAYNTLITESGANTSIVGTISNGCCLSLDGAAVANGQIPATSYTGSAAIYFAGQPAVNDTITTGTLAGGVSTNTHVWTWVSGAPGANQIQIGANVAASVANAAAKLNTDNNFGSAVTGSARYSKPSNIDTTGFLNLYVDGDLVQAVPMGVYSTDTNPTITTMAAAVTASGWSASPANSYNLFRAASLGGIGTFANFDALNRTHPMTVGYDPHAEWVHTYTGGNTKQNATWRNNRVWDYRNAPFVNDEATVRWDFIWAGNSWDGNGNNNFQYVGGTAAVYSHNVMKYNSGTWGVTRLNDAGQDYTYSRGFNNAFHGGYPYGTSAPNCFPNGFGWINNIYEAFVVGGSPCLMTGPHDSGNIDISPSTVSTLFVGSGTGDFRPAGAALTNLVPKVNDLDGRVLPFAATDAMGAWSKNDPAP